MVLMIPDADITKPGHGRGLKLVRERHTKSLRETIKAQTGKWKTGTSRTKNKPRLRAQQAVQGGEKANTPEGWKDGSI